MSKIKTGDFLENIHATCVTLDGQGVLLLGASGSGKSDLALRLIQNKQAVLVADDRVDLSISEGELQASAPEILKGLLEIRGVGIVKMPHCPQTKVCLAVELLSERTAAERMPPERFCEWGGVKIPQLSLYPFESSAPDKVVIKLKALLD